MTTKEHPGLAIGFTADALLSLRIALAAQAQRLGLGGARLGELVLVATELITNVIQHSGGQGYIRMWRSGECVYCEVTDNGPGITDPARVGTEPVPPGGESGRGLWIVRQLTDECTISARDPGTCVTVTFDL